MKIFRLLFFLSLIIPQFAYCQNKSVQSDSNKTTDNDTCVSIFLDINYSKCPKNIMTFGSSLKVFNYSKETLTFPSRQLIEDYLVRGNSINEIGKYIDVVFQYQKKTKKVYVDYFYPPSNIDIDEVRDLTDTIFIKPNYSDIFNVTIVPYNVFEKGKYRVRAYFNASKYANCTNIWSNWVYFEVINEKKKIKLD